MQVLVQVRGYVDPADLWPYVTDVLEMPSSWLLSMDVHDSRELVSAVIALAQRGVEIHAVEVGGRDGGVDG